jgi:D-alanine-D-alanine ligase
MALLTGKRIGVIMGGRSAEREVSIKSGSAILSSLKRSGYDAIPIDMDEKISENIKGNNIGVAFIALHGPGGEDGSLQGLLEIIGIPYTGSGVLASALGLNKAASRKIFLYHNIQVPPFLIARRDERTDIESILRKLTFSFPLVVKPCCQGSSIGVSIVKEKKELKEGIDEAFRYDSEILIEKFIDGREIHVGILGDKPLGAIEILPKGEFYDYEAKYVPGMSDHIFPAPLEEGMYRRVLEAGLSAHNAIGCEGYGRTDCLVTGNGDIFILEVNTLPGMTETSLLPEIAAKSGIGFDALVEKILGFALNRFAM